MEGIPAELSCAFYCPHSWGKDMLDIEVMMFLVIQTEAVNVVRWIIMDKIARTIYNLLNKQLRIPPARRQPGGGSSSAVGVDFS